MNICTYIIDAKVTLSVTFSHLNEPLGNEIASTLKKDILLLFESIHIPYNHLNYNLRFNDRYNPLNYNQQ